MDDAVAVIEDNGDSVPLDSSKGNASLERGLSLATRGSQAILMSQKGKKDTLNFTLQVRKLLCLGVTILLCDSCRYPSVVFSEPTDLQLLMLS